MFDPETFPVPTHRAADPRAAELARGIALYRMGLLDEAHRVIECALADGEDQNGLLALGCLHFERGEVAPAAFYFERALASDPDNALLAMYASECRARLEAERPAPVRRAARGTQPLTLAPWQLAA